MTGNFGGQPERALGAPKPVGLMSRGSAERRRRPADVEAEAPMFSHSNRLSTAIDRQSVDAKLDCGFPRSQREIQHLEPPPAVFRRPVPARGPPCARSKAARVPAVEPRQSHERLCDPGAEGTCDRGSAFRRLRLCRGSDRAHRRNQGEHPYIRCSATLFPPSTTIS